MESKPVFELHKLPEGYIVTSDEQIKEGDTFKHPDNTLERASRNLDGRGLSKVIAQQDQIDFSSLSEEQQREIGLNQYDFAQMFYEILKKTYPYFDEWIEAKEYKKAQSLLSDRRFTLEELEWAFMRGALINQRSHSGEILSFTTERNKDIQSLSQKSWKIEVEMELNLNGRNGLERASFIPKLTNGKIKILKLC
jgi:hypothetical protein